MAQTLDRTATVGQLVTDNPARARVLEAAGIDYCCGGQRTVAVACAEAGIDAEQLLAAVQGVDGDAASRPAWADLGPAALASHLQATHHAYLWDELPRLAALATKVAAAHGGNHPELAAVGATFGRLRDELEPHLAREEEIVFPACRRLGRGAGADELAAVVAVLRDEHDEAGELLDALRELTGGFVVPDDGCPSYVALYAGLAELDQDTRLHVHKENNLLFPALAAASTGPTVEASW